MVEVGAVGGLAAALAMVAPPPMPGQGYIFIPLRGGVPFDVMVDTAIVTSVNEHEAQIVDMRGDLVTMVDSYASRPAPDGGCTDGREVYVRLLDLAAGRERVATLARSCRRGITAADPLVSWHPDGSGYTVNLTSDRPLWIAASTGG